MAEDIYFGSVNGWYFVAMVVLGLTILKHYIPFILGCGLAMLQIHRIELTKCLTAQ